MSRIGQYSKDKNKPLPEWKAWKEEPSNENFQKLYEQVKPVVKSAMRSFANEDPTLETRAKILTAEAFKSFDPEKGAALTTHVYNRLQRLQRYRAERSSAVHIPENTRLDAAAVMNYENEYKATHGLEPSDSQVSDALDMSLARIKRTRNIGEASGAQMLSEKGDIPAHEPEFDRMWADYVYFDLGEIDKKIYEWVTGYNGNKKLPKREIAKRLRISPAAVSQRVGRIANKLQEGMK